MLRRIPNADLDSLTGLFTRKALDRLFDSFLKGDRAAIFLVDIDHFKLVNDCSGHKRGDEILVAFAQFFKKMAKGGFVFRMGGDEFLLVRPGSSESALRHFAERLLRTTAGKVFEGEPDLRITLSIGISFFPGEGRTLPELLSVADKRLYHAKRSGRNRLCISDPVRDESEVIHKPVRLTGREKPFLSMKEALDTVIKGHVRVFVVGGERGVGKTFLCDRFLEYAAMRGGIQRRISLIDSAFGSTSARIREIIEGLFSNTEELQEYLVNINAFQRDDIEILMNTQREKSGIDEYRLQRALITLLEMRALREKFLVVFIDNFERAAGPGIRLLDFLARARQDSPILILIGFECNAPRGCEEIRLRYRDEDKVEIASLGCFSKKEHRILVKSLLGGGRIGNEIFEFTYRKTEGNPLLTRELLVAATEQHWIVYERGEWRMQGKEKVGISNSLNSFLEDRLYRLSNEEREMLKSASVFGEEFESRIVAELMACEEGNIIALLRLPIVFHMVCDQGNGRFAFRLMYHEVISSGIPDTEKALLHRRAAEILERSGARGHRKLSFHHYRCAGEQELAKRVARTLLRRLMEQGEFKEARQYADFLVHHRSSDDPEEHGLLPLAARCYGMNGLHQRAIELYRELAVASPTRKNQGMLEIARLLRKQGKLSLALNELLAIQTKSSALLCETMHEIAETLLQLGKLEKAEEYAKKAILLSNRWGKKKQEADGYYTIAGIFWYRGEFELAEEFLHKALAIYEQMDAGERIARTMNRLGIVQWSCGKLEDAVSLVEKALAGFKAQGSVEEENRAYTNLGILNEAMGRWKEAQAYYRRSLDMALFLNLIPLACRNYNNLGTLLVKQGDLEEALRLLKKAIHIRTKSGEKIDLGSSIHNLGVAYMYRGMYTKAAYFLARARTIFEERGATGMLISNLNALFELHTSTRQFEKAQEMEKQLSALIETSGTDLQRAQFFRVLAKFHRAREMIDESRKYARLSLELLGEEYELYERGKALYELGLALLEGGSKEEARRVLRRSRAAFKRVGAKKALERVEHSMVKRGMGLWERGKRRKHR
jgi:diguanylate cyclase (GGDEF)-like protein